MEKSEKKRNVPWVPRGVLIVHPSPERRKYLRNGRPSENFRILASNFNPKVWNVNCKV